MLSIARNRNRVSFLPVSASRVAYEPCNVSAMLSGCLFLYDSRSIAGLVTGDDVSSWVDGSGNGYTLTEGTADNKPHYTQNVINGYPSVRFDGSNDRLRNTSFASSFTNGDLTLILVFSAIVQTQYRGVLCFAGTGANDYNAAHGISTEQATNAMVATRQQGADALSISGQMPPNAFRVMSLVRNNGTAYLYQNKAQVATDSYSDKNTITPNIISVSARITAGSPDGYGNNDMVFIVGFDGDIGATKRNAIEAYLMMMYAI